MAIQANEEWRTDPDRRARARNLCTVRAVYLRKLIDALKQAQEYSHELYHSGYREVPSQALQIEQLERSYNHFARPTETLIGNMAAFEEGSK
jgi:hypothetical protein